MRCACLSPCRLDLSAGLTCSKLRYRAGLACQPRHAAHSFDIAAPSGAAVQSYHPCAICTVPAVYSILERYRLTRNLSHGTRRQGIAWPGGACRPALGRLSGCTSGQCLRQGCIACLCMVHRMCLHAAHAAPRPVRWAAQAIRRSRPSTGMPVDVGGPLTGPWTP